MSKFIQLENPNDNFNFFIQNLKGITYFNKGTFGFTFILEIKDDVQSPYEYIESKQKIKKILLKICGTCGEGNCDTKKKLKISSSSVETLSVPALEKECQLQNKVYDCGKEHREQLCPKIFYCEIMDTVKTTSFLNQLIPLVSPVKKTGFLNRFKKPEPPSREYVILSEILQNLSQIDGLYVSLMEYADGYVTLRQLEYKKEEYLYNYARAALLKLALYCSISHNDPNKNNILINKVNNHVLLIDFGSTIDLHNKEEITPEEKTKIITNLKHKKYKIALKICNKMYKEEFDYRGEPIGSPLEWVHDSADISIIQPIIQPIIDSLPLQDSDAEKEVVSASAPSPPAASEKEVVSASAPSPPAASASTNNVQFTCYNNLLKNSEYTQILYIDRHITDENMDKAKIILVDHKNNQCYNVTYKGEHEELGNHVTEYTYYDNDNDNNKIFVQQHEINQNPKPDDRFRFSLFVNTDIIPKPPPRVIDVPMTPPWMENGWEGGRGGGKSRKKM